MVLKQKNKTQKQILPFCGIKINQLCLDRGQTREICEIKKKKKKMKNTSRKGTVVIFTLQSFILFQHRFDLPDFWNFTSSKYLKMGKFGLVGAICQSNLLQLRST